jgi:hypothetical protein
LEVTTAAGCPEISEATLAEALATQVPRALAPRLPGPLESALGLNLAMGIGAPVEERRGSWRVQLRAPEEAAVNLEAEGLSVSYTLAAQAEAALIGIFPKSSARADGLAAKGRCEFRAGVEENGRQVGARNRHELGGQGFVAPAQAHNAIDRIGAKGLLDLHGQHVPVKHSGGLHEFLAEGESVEFQGNATGLLNALTHMDRQIPQTEVAGVKITPCVGDSNDGTAGACVRIHAGLPQNGAVLEAKFVWTVEPFGGAEHGKAFFQDWKREGKPGRSARRAASVASSVASRSPKVWEKLILACLAAIGIW